MVNIYEQKLTNLQQSILRLLSIKLGKPLNQNQIAKYLNVSQAAVKKAMPFLEENEYIISRQDKETRRWEIQLNIENQEIIYFTPFPAKNLGRELLFYNGLYVLDLFENTDC